MFVSVSIVTAGACDLLNSDQSGLNLRVIISHALNHFLAYELGFGIAKFERSGRVLDNDFRNQESPLNRRVVTNSGDGRYE